MQGAGTHDTSPLTARLLRALGGGGAAESAVPPLRWTGEGSRAVALLRRLASRCPTGTLRVPDHLASGLAARPLLVTAIALPLLPALRIALPEALAGPAAVAVLAVVLLALLLGLAGSLHDGTDRRTVIRLLLAGALLRVGAGLVLGVSGGFPDERWIYHPLAREAAGAWSVGGPSILGESPVVAGRALYFHLLGGTYLLTGPALVAGRVLGGALGLLGAILCGELARALGGRRAALLGVALLALHPEHAFWSATLSRDGLSVVLVLLCLVLVLRRPGRLLRGNLLPAALPAAALCWNSFPVAGVLAATLALLCVGEAFRAAGPTPRGVALPGLALVLAAGALVYVGHRYGRYLSPEMLTDVRSLGLGVAPDFLPDLRFEGFLGVALYLPLGALFVLAAPFPWTAVHVNRAAYGGLAALGLVVTVLGVVGLVAAARRRAGAAAPPVVFALLLLAVLGVLESNSGILVRHRLPLTAVLAAGAAALLAGLRRPAVGDPAQP